MKQTTKQGKKEFSEMSKKEKKEFLSNDLIERMIRVEQRVSAHFRQPVPYNKTEYYKSLTEEEKRNFETYLKRKGRKKFLLPLLFIVILTAIVFLRAEFTGQIVRENIGEGTSFLLENFLILILLITILSLTISSISKKKREKRFREHYKVLENIFLKKEKK